MVQNLDDKHEGLEGVAQVPGTEEIYAVDNHLYGVPEALSSYIIAGESPALVDCGAANTSGHIIDALDKLGIPTQEVEHMFVSHVHLDHAGGAGHLAEECTNANIYVHEKGLDYLTSEDKLNRLTQQAEKAIGIKGAYGNPSLVPQKRCTKILDDDTIIEAGQHTFRLINSPGHAPHHYTIYDESTEVLFAIDAAGMRFDSEMLPTTPPPTFDLEKNLATLDRLRELHPQINCYGHFGPGSPGKATDEIEEYSQLLPKYVKLIEDLADKCENTEAIHDELDTQWLSPTTYRDIAGVLDYLD